MSSRSFSSVGSSTFRPGSASSNNSANLAKIYSGANSSSGEPRPQRSDSSSNASRDSSNRFRQSDRMIHLSNVDSDDNLNISPASSNGVIRIEMQPKRQIRMRNDGKPQSAAAE